ncbi:MAG: hypothetical protein R8P61_23685 [Bacteroidia bacterium]|nr:hypothetical protein [Bacteroidia bacterium]
MSRHSFHSQANCFQQKFSHITFLLLFISCSACETAVVPVSGTYTGLSETISFRFEEIFDGNGNMVGIMEVRDTLINQADVLSLNQVGKESKFKLEVGTGLDKLKTFSNHEFSYEGQSEFSVVSLTDRVETRRLEFSIDGSGNMELSFSEDENPDPNARPAGTRILFSGIKN